MTLQAYINSRNITKYHLSQISGVPKTTVIDICSGKSSLEKCSAKTVQQLARALNCTMEEIMTMDAPNTKLYDKDSGLPMDEGYLELGLPAYLERSLHAMEQAWAKEDSGERDPHWDIAWCELNADINAAEIEQEITSEQAWHLREKFLRMERGDEG